MATDSRFSARLRELLEARGISYRALSAHTYYGKSYLHELATGRKAPSLEVAKAFDEALRTEGEFAAMIGVAASAAFVDEIDALELARRVSASDVGFETLGQLERAFDDLATAYTTTPPAELLRRVRKHLAYVVQLIDARKTLAQHRRLVVVGGWLSLLGAALHIDLRQPAAARAHLTTATQLAEHGDHAEIRAWCLETKAWEVLTDGDYRQAVELSRQAQAIAPRGSSAEIQAAAQEGRAWARMDEQARTRQALARVSKLVSTLGKPDRPEHHYRYDPDKALSYTATTLAWAGDPAAEDYARTVISQLETPANGIARPRRIAAARLDLGLALLASGKPDEAAHVTTAAITSGRVVPSNWWRATEILTGVERCGISEASDLRDAYESYRPSASTGGR